MTYVDNELKASQIFSIRLNDLVLKAKINWIISIFSVLFLIIGSATIPFAKYLSYSADPSYLDIPSRYQAIGIVGIVFLVLFAICSLVNLVLNIMIIIQANSLETKIDYLKVTNALNKANIFSIVGIFFGFIFTLLAWYSLKNANENAELLRLPNKDKVFLSFLS